MLSDQFFWFATRSAGLLTWFAATGSVGIGLLMSTRALGRKPTIPWLLDVHRFLSAASIVFLGIHLITLWADDFIDFGLAELFVPGKAQVGGLSGFSLALGVVALWLLVVVEASSLIKDRLPNRLWHTVHLTSFGVVILGLVHGIEVGSDSDNRILVAASVSMLMAVLILTGTRISRVLSDRKYRYEIEASAPESEEEEEFAEFDHFEDLAHIEPLGSYEATATAPVRTKPYPPPERQSSRPRRQDDFVLGDRSTTDW